MPLSRKKRYIADDFFEMFPEETIDRNKELIDGEIIEMSAPSILHQSICGEVFAEIRNYIKRNNGNCKPMISPFDVRLDDYNVVMPDISVICDKSKLSDGKRCNGAPDWVIEVASSNRSDDFYRKLALYQEHEVREYWIIDPKYKKTLVYFFDESRFPSIYTFEMSIPVGIYKNNPNKLQINIAELLI